ncbi:MAG: prolyl oligopeptidase family serine peptidase [Pirellulales bacterium]
MFDLRRLTVAASFVCLACASPSARGADEAADPRRPPAITTSDVPVVPSEFFERLRQYQNVRTAGFQGWAADGRGMLIGTRFGNSVQLHRVYEPGGRREQVTFFDEPAGGRPLPKADDGALLVTMSEGGNENFQIFLLDRTTGEATLLTDGKSRNELGPVSEDGARMIVHSNRRNGRDTDIYVTDTRQAGEGETLLETDGEFWFAADWSRDGSRLALLHYVSINESYPATLDLATKKLTPLPMPAVKGAEDKDARPAKIAFGAATFTPDGRSLYVTTDARGEYLELAKVDLANGRYQWLAPDLGWDVQDVEVDPNTGLVAFTVNVDGASQIYLLAAGGQPTPVELPLGVIAGLEFSPDGKRLGFTLARPDAPADAYSIDIADGRAAGAATRWTFSEVGGLNPATFVRPERITFSSFDGREVPAHYYRPPTATREKPAAVVIDIHGGPESQSRPIFSGTTQFLVVEEGIAVIYPNVRGSAGYGKTYLLLDNAERREDSVKDIGALLDWIARQPELDASRIAVQGGSYGGYMVLASLVHYGERIRAGIDIVGIASFISFLERTSPYRQDLRRAEYGDERDPEMRKVFERISPLAGADKIQAALMVAHGVNDPRVPYFEAQQIAEKVRAAGRPVWTVYADNEGHGFGKKDNRDYLTAVQMLFLERFLKGT